MGARYPYYLLADSPEGQRKEAEVTRAPPKQTPTRCDIRQGFVYERVPHVTLKSIANNAEIDVIWEKWQATLELLRAQLNAALGRTQPSLRTEGEALLRGAEATQQTQASPPKPGSPRRFAPRDDGLSAWEEWEIPREADATWPAVAKEIHSKWWQARIARQQEIDASIAAKAEFEYLYDKPYTDSGRIRVAGPFTVESLSLHRVLAVDQNEELLEISNATAGVRPAPRAKRRSKTSPK